MNTLTQRVRTTHPVLLGLLTSIVATVANYVVPEAHAGEVVGLIFLVAAITLALPRDSPTPASHYGLSLGGLLDPVPLSLRRALREGSIAFLIATAIALLVLPPFWLGYVWWFSPDTSFDWDRALRVAADEQGLWGWANLCLVHLLVVALPEEAFFRGYLQTTLADRWPGGWPALGKGASALLVSSTLFALGHMATTPVLGRLAVFFPSLLFGLLRSRTGGIGASIILHAQCNVFSALLNAGYGFR